MNANFQIPVRVQRALSRLEAEDKTCMGLSDALCAADSALRDVPETYSMSVMTHLSPEGLGPDSMAGAAQLFQHIERMLSLLHHVGCCRLAELVRGVLRSFEQHEYTHTCLLTRALIEHSAILQYRQNQLVPLVGALDRLHPSDVAERLRSKTNVKQIFETLIPALSLVDKCFSAGRFNREALSRMDSLVEIEMRRDDHYRQIGVMDAIDACTWMGPLWQATNPRFYYELLSDYAHPNFGANVLYVEEELEVEIAAASGARNKIRRSTTSSEPGSESLLLHVLMLVYVPMRESTGVITACLNQMAEQIRVRREFNDSLVREGVAPILRVASGV